MSWTDFLSFVKGFFGGPNAPPAVPPAPKLVPGGTPRPWRLTTYYVAAEVDATGDPTVPVYDRDRRVLGKVSASFFAQMSLEGTGLLKGGRLLNVAGSRVPVDPKDYAPVLSYHRRFLGAKPAPYSGIEVSSLDPESVVRAFAFEVVSAAGVGFGMAGGKPLVPFKTVAADTGQVGTSEPAWKGKGGVCPRGTRAYVAELDGKLLPDGLGGTFAHDGWVEVTDAGGGIYGCHFDVFCGTKSMARSAGLPDLGHVWYDRVAERAPAGYAYGLKG